MNLIYLILWSIVSTLALPFVCLPALWSKSWRESLPERLTFGAWNSWFARKQSQKQNDVVWFHAASLGEVSGISSLVKNFSAEHPTTQILVTTTSLTGRAEAKKRGLCATPCLLPLDHPLLWRRFFTSLRPRLLVIAETEIWPGLLICAGLFRVPVLVVNGRISDYSFKRYEKLSFLLKPLWKNVTRFLVQTARDAERYQILGVPVEKITVAGSTKYDQAVPEFSDSELTQLAQSLGLTREEPIFVAGSVRPGELEIVLDVFETAKKTVPTLQLLLAPRHPERFEDAAAAISRRGLVFNRRSAGSAARSQAVLLLDSLGELSRVYALSTVAFVGGTLENIGGHNPLEPAAHRAPVILGPYTANVRDAVEELRRAGGMREVKDAAEFTAALLELVLDDQLADQVGAAAEEVWEQNSGATARALSELNTVFSKPQIPISDAQPLVVSIVLGTLSAVYGAVTAGRNLLYDRGILKTYSSDLPVISVGNLTAGGNGKTPFVQFLAQTLLEAGKRPVILSRGYGGSITEPHVVRATDAPAFVGDEALMQKQTFGDAVPVVIARARIEGALLIQTENLGDVILLDDGFQHRALAREVDLVLVDVSSKAACVEWTNGRLLPWGRFRESKSHGLKRASGVVRISRGVNPAGEVAATGLPTFDCQLKPASFVDIATGEELSLEKFAGVNGAALTAIAKPEGFFVLLEKLGVKLETRSAYRDHYLFTANDLIALGGKQLFVTEKDAVKLRSFVAPGECFALKIKAEFAPGGQKKFLELIAEHTGLEFPGVRSVQNL